jgi:hypothetical protein
MSLLKDSYSFKSLIEVYLKFIQMPYLLTKGCVERAIFFGIFGPSLCRVGSDRNVKLLLTRSSY